MLNSNFNNWPKRLLLGLIFVLAYMILSYKLISVPPGINFDESSIGYNASLIAKNLRDENNRFLPVFILTLDGKDWKQPVNVYSTTLMFEFFGRSYFNLRLVSVIFALISGFIFFKILRLFFSYVLSLVGLSLFLTSPSILIQSHLASDNISSLPFILLWVYFLFSFDRNRSPYRLLLSGIFLGASFYSYKAMHAIVPVYLALSLVYLFISYKMNIRLVLFFLFGIIPFLLPIPWLQIHYAGAIYDSTIVRMPSYFDALYTYLSSFDFSFLFVKGDKMLVHSTGYYGMFLLPILVLFFLGLFEIVKEKKPSYYFILLAFLLIPLPLTTVGSVYRASRLMPYIPFVTFIAVLGIKRILDIKYVYRKVFLLVIFSLAMVFNYFNLLYYYWGDYPKVIRQDFSPNLDRALSVLKSTSLEQNKLGYLEKSFFLSHKADLQFFWEVYYPDQSLRTWNRETEELPQNSLILTAMKGSGNAITYKEIPGPKPDTFYIVGR